MTSRRTKILTQLLIDATAFCCALVTLPFSAHADGFKTNAPILQNPFDLASGGASLTRASLDGLLFVNPSLSALGPGFFRWLFLRTTVNIGAEPQSLVTKIVKTRKVDLSTLADAAKANFQTGPDFATGVITTNIAVAAFNTLRVDVNGLGLDDLGIPKAELTAADYGGLVVGTAKEFFDLISFGASAKVIYGAEAGVSLGRDDLLNTGGLKDKALSALKRGGGFGYDASLSLQKRTHFLDVRAAAVVDDIHGTRVANLPTWPQSISVGLGVTLHTSSHAFHCSYDLRDVKNAYDESKTNKTYMGCKFLFANMLAIGAGYGQGLPAVGVLWNTFFTRLELGMYGTHYGTSFGLRERKLYYLGFGFHIP